MRDKQYLVAIRAEDKVLVMSTLFFADEVRDPRQEIDDLPRAHKFSSTRPVHGEAADLLAVDPLGSDEATATPTATGSTDMIKRKHKGEEIVRNDDDEAQGGEVVDLLEALRASVDAAKGKRGVRRCSHEGNDHEQHKEEATTKKATRRRHGEEDTPRRPGRSATKKAS